jgi:hypothetical protein
MLMGFAAVFMRGNGVLLRFRMPSVFVVMGCLAMMMRRVFMMSSSLMVMFAG